MARVEFKNCYKFFDDGTQALDDFTLAIEDGELMVLVGPSGCGKSTCLRLLAGLDNPNSGDILIAGESITHRPPQLRNIAMVFQNYALYPHMSVYDNLAFPLKMSKQKKSEIDINVRDVAETLHLTDLLQRKPQQLSGGQRQRVAMGRALVRRPRVFLMDEPLSNLDAKLRVQIRAEIAALQQRLKITTVYVTHDQTEAMSLGNRVTVMESGKIQQVDSPDELYTHPRNTFVAEFIGNPGMNIVPAIISRNQITASLKLGDHGFALPDSYKQLFESGEHEVQLGVRPEGFHLSSEQSPISANCVNVESFGHEKIVYFNSNWSRDRLMTMRINQAPPSAGDTFRLGIDLEQVYLFDRNGSIIR